MEWGLKSSVRVKYCSPKLGSVAGYKTGQTTVLDYGLRSCEELKFPEQALYVRVSLVKGCAPYTIVDMCCHVTPSTGMFGETDVKLQRNAKKGRVIMTVDLYIQRSASVYKCGFCQIVCTAQ